jgi:hypothetical protein
MQLEILIRRFIWKQFELANKLIDKHLLKQSLKQ